MKALTISQPFASLIAAGEKWVENRNWPTKYRGPLAIHAGKGTQYLSLAELRKYQTGQVIAVANLVACVSYGDVCNMVNQPEWVQRWIGGTRRTWWEVFNHSHTEGPWCWILDSVWAIDPVDASGRQGLWDWEEAEGLERRLLRKMDQAVGRPST